MARTRENKGYHLTARPNKAARNRIWHAWKWEGDKRVWRSTEKHRKEDAEAVVKSWEEEDKAKAAAVAASPALTLRTYAADFFIPGRCPYIAWKASHGLKPGTIAEHRSNLVNHLLPLFGDSPLGGPSEPDIEAAVSQLHLSGTSKNAVLNTYRIIMVEAKRARLVDAVPEWRRFARNSLRRDILTAEECRKLFPDDVEELARLWRLASDDSTGLLFGLLFRLILHAGLRPAEGRAVCREQLYPQECGLLVDRQLDSELEVSLPKKGTQEDPRHRLVIIPRTTMDLLQAFTTAEEIEAGPLFQVGGRWVDKDWLARRWRAGLAAAEIRVGDRTLTPYSLRYTYRSRSQGALDGEVLRSMMGHRGAEISDHYLVVNPEQLAALGAYRETIDNLWE